MASTVYTEGKYTAEFIINEANGTRSKDTGTVLSGENLKAGAVVGIVTASGKYKEYNPANADGSETVAGISYANNDATNGDIANAVIVVRDAEVSKDGLEYFTGATPAQKVTALTGLEALGIIGR